jgi:HEPN domain
MGPAIWLALARDELRAAELLGEHGIAPLSCLHADQAIEKALWAFHLHREGGSRQSVDGGIDCPALSDYRLPTAASRLGAQRHGLAAALASLSLQSTHRQPTGPCGGPDAEAELAREAVQVAQELIDRITERVYADVRS